MDRPDCESVSLTGQLPEGTVIRALKGLIERGLASSERLDGVTRYRAASPLLVLGPLLEQRRNTLNMAEALMSDLSERHRSAQTVQASGTPIEILSGAVAIRRRMLTLQRHARFEVRALVQASNGRGVLSYEDNHHAVEQELADRGVVMRSVIERKLLEEPMAATVLSSGIAQGQHIAVTERLPIKLVIVDARVALLPLDPERDEAEPVALVVHRTGLLTALCSLFDEHFDKGWPLHVSEGGIDLASRLNSTGAHDRQIVALLHIGLTDVAIARQLGVGYRTVQRRLQAMMAEAGAATRFQLGCYAVRSGWLDGEPDNSSARTSN
ncbi:MULTISPECIES: helix-turn-helix transcriptional regulator [unclassified Streptomyces]|uniref:helix-turn-helix transcriptional regulator n=1 Tax=Streptomyces sp. NPDC127532 TaxID=3345399 RepID=UPI003637E707